MVYIRATLTSGAKFSKPHLPRFSAAQSAALNVCSTGDCEAGRPAALEAEAAKELPASTVLPTVPLVFMVFERQEK